jgi:F0F1-type ATP synthase membrane subunit c/vacuolar-type H+-ATPase subunit K
MALEASDALVQLVIFAGVMIGNVGGATIIPYIKAKAKYADFDIKILFDNKFLMTCAGTAVVAFVVVSGSFSTFLNQVIVGQPSTYLAAFIAALGIGYTLNATINSILPNPTNPQAARKLEEQKLARALTLRGIDLEKLSNMTEKTEDREEETINQV